MKAIVKWGGIAAVILLVLIIGAVVLIPRFVDINQYKPKIETLVAEQTGRSFSMGDDISLSVFPWVGVRLTDLALGNAKGFARDHMISVKGFEVRLKVLPLLSRQVVVDTFVVDSPHIFLGKDKKGAANWEGLGSGKAQGKKQAGKVENPSAGQSLPIKSLLVNNFSIVNGLLSYLDQTSGLEKQVSDFNLALTDISLDKPIGIMLSALVEGKPASLEGQLGPVGKEPGTADISFDLVVKALDVLEAKIGGWLIQPAGKHKISLDIVLSHFSPRKVFKELDQEFPIKTNDPQVLDKISLNVKIDADASEISLSEGIMELDDSTFNFMARVREFKKPDLKFDLSLDDIDLDRYLPPKEENASASQVKAGTETGSGKEKVSQGAEKKKTDYAPLRKMVLDGKVKIGKLKASNMSIQKMVARVKAKNGVFDLAPFSMDLYGGSLASKARLDIRKNTPVSSMNLDLKQVQAGPMITDALQKEVIEGDLAARMNLDFTGDSPEMIKKTLGGNGELKFADGSVIGIDIAGTVREVSSGLGMTDNPKAKPRTDFAELAIPFSARKGVVSIPGARLTSPFLRLIAQGNTSLALETLDFRLDPKLVDPLKGKGDTGEPSGIWVPLLVTGTYASPKVRPDLETMAEKKLFNEEAVKSLMNPKDGSREDAAKDLLKGLFKN